MKRTLSREAVRWLKDLADADGWNAEKIAKEIGVKRRQYFNVLGGSTVSSAVQALLVEFARREDGPSPDHLFAMDSVSRSGTSRDTVIYGNIMLRHFNSCLSRNPRKLRNYVLHPPLRESLLDFKKLPPLYAVVRGSTAVESSGDDFQHLPHSYDHIVSIGAIVEFAWEGQETPHFLCYRPTLPSFEADDRCAPQLLWNCAFLRDMAFEFPDFKSPMDNWLEAVSENPSVAESAFTDGANPVLLALLHHEVQLREFHQIKISPFGVLTIDQRIPSSSQPEGRRTSSSPSQVHSAYVFKVIVQIDSFAAIDEEVLSISTPHLPIPRTLPEIAKESAAGTNAESKIPFDETNSILALALKMPGEEIYRRGRAAFVEGFAFKHPLMLSMKKPSD